MLSSLATVLPVLYMTEGYWLLLIKNGIPWQPSFRPFHHCSVRGFCPFLSISKYVKIDTHSETGSLD
jgi:hypothetical protein